MADFLERLLLRVEADTQGMRNEMRVAGTTIQREGNRWQRSMRVAGRAAQDFARRVTSLRSVVASLAGAGGLGLAIRRAVDFADEIGKTADQIGISTDALQEWRFAADLAGVSQERLDRGFETFAQRLGEAQAGTGTLLTFLNRMPDSFRQAVLAADSVDEAIDLIIRQMASLERQQDRAALSAAAFGRGVGGEMANLVREGADAIDEVRESARRMGIVIDEDLIRTSEEAKDQMTILSTVIRSNFTRGLLEGFVGEFTDFADAVQDPNFQQSVREFGDTFGSLMRFIVENGETIIRVFAAFKGAQFGARVGRLGGVPGTVLGAAGGGALGFFFPELAGLTGDELEAEISELEAQLERAQASLEQNQQQMRALQFRGEMDSDAFQELEKSAESLETRIDDIRFKLRALREELQAGPGTPARPRPEPFAPAVPDGGSESGTDDNSDDFVEKVGSIADKLRAQIDRERQEAQRLLDELERARLRAEGDQVALIQRSLSERLAAIDEARLTEQEAAQARANAVIAADREIRRVYARQAEAGAESMERVAEVGRDAMDELIEATQGFGRNFSRAMAEALLTGEATFRGLGESFAVDFAERVIQTRITSPLFRALEGALDGGFAGLFSSGPQQSISPVGGPIGFGQAAAAGFDGSRAEGGRVEAGRAVVVGERGRSEIFIPDRDGFIVPMSGGGRGPAATPLGGTVTNVIIREAPGRSEGRVSERSNAQGGTDIEVEVDRLTSRNLRRFGSQSNRAVRESMTTRQQLIQR